MEYDIADILTRIEEGETFREIAAVYGVNVSSISRLLDKEENAQQSARARSISAESWLDRGFHELVDAKTSEEITRARYIAQECARRAALRNPAYREKQDHNHSGSLTLNVASELAALNSSSSATKEPKNAGE